MQNNIFSGVGAATNQVNAIDKTNYRSLSPAFVDRAGYNLTPAPGSAMIDAGSAVGPAANGGSLIPTAQYVHPAAGTGRPTVGAIDIGAYEAGSGVTPDPTPVATEKCDVDGNNKVDINDINAIMGARGQRITAANQKYDIDGDGVISVNDARTCVLKCTNAKCVP
jgi:hypothetical protein